MYCKEITYTGYDDQLRTEKFYFNLNKAEIAEMMLTDSDATLDQVFEYFRQTRNGKQLFKMVKDLISSSYGVKSADGRSFLKTPEITQAFMQSEAFSELFMELLADPDKVAEFFIGIVPKDLQKNLSDVYKRYPNMTPEDVDKVFAERRAAAEIVDLKPVD